jgi:transposase
MRAYSMDIRQHIVAAVEAGEHSLRALAELFSVSLSTIVRLLQRFRTTGSVQPKPHGGGRRPSWMPKQPLVCWKRCINSPIRPSRNCGTA